MTAHIAPAHRKKPVFPSLLPHRPRFRQSCYVAVIDVDGMLFDSDTAGLGSWGENPVAIFRERLDAIEANPRIRAVVLRINSPGGSVTATDIMWRDLQAFKARTRLPVVACIMDVGTGGAYYLATGAQQIFAHPTTITGSIGCILNIYNLEDMMSMLKIHGTPVKSGPHVDLGSASKPLDDESRRMLQSMADEFHQRFKRVVCENRPVDGRIPTTFDGRVFTASHAMRIGLIDQIGYLDDAVRCATQMAGLSYAEVTFLRRDGDTATSPYSTSPNVPLHDKFVNLDVPGLQRSRMPSFLYLWQIEPTAETINGK
ncbi:MAG: signal peptide peptidase SppA [Planctomycetaceae bacterium]